MSAQGVDVVRVAEKFAPEVVYLHLVELESRLARLEEGLRRMANHDFEHADEYAHELRDMARALLADQDGAGLDTPAIPPRPPIQPPGHQREMADTPADSRLREYVCAHDHRWFMQPAFAPNGCPMCNTISFRLIAPADSQEDKT